MKSTHIYTVYLLVDSTLVKQAEYKSWEGAARYILRHAPDQPVYVRSKYIHAENIICWNRCTVSAHRLLWNTKWDVPPTITVK